MTPAVLELRNVTRVYGTGQAEVLAFRGVSLTVSAGELVAVMGAVGVGQEHAADPGRRPGRPHAYHSA